MVVFTYHKTFPNRSTPERDTGSFADIVELLYYHRNSECSDVRDSIYSLLGFIDWGVTPGIQPLEPDYTISSDELFRQLILRLRAIDRPTDEDNWKLHAMNWPEADYSLLYEHEA